MNTLPRSLCAAAAAAVLAGLAGCATPYHYSWIDGYRYAKTPLDTHPLIISKVDGVSTMPGRVPVLVDPGYRQLEVQTYPSASDRLGVEKTVALDVKPCTHYYLVAVKSNRLVRDYDVKVEYEEPVPGCTPPPAK
jgi:hypothetical protein